MIIGITGTFGAGKGTLANYLVKKKGYKHFSAITFLTEEIIKRGLPVTRDSMVLVANELRAKYSPSYIAEQLIKQASDCDGDAVVESIRVLGEVEELKKANGVLVSIDASIEKRYNRIIARNSETDNISFEKFKVDEEKEMNSTDPNKQNIASVMRLADVHLENNDTIDDLERNVEEKLF